MYAVVVVFVVPFESCVMWCTSLPLIMRFMFCVEYELNYMHVSETEGKTLPVIFFYIFILCIGCCILFIDQYPALLMN